MRKDLTTLGFERGHGCLLYKTVSRQLLAGVENRALTEVCFLKRGIIDIDHA